VQHFASFMSRQVCNKKGREWDGWFQGIIANFIWSHSNWCDRHFNYSFHLLKWSSIVSSHWHWLLCDFNAGSKAGWGHYLFQTFEEGQTTANFVDAGSLSSVHSRLAYIGSGCLLRMLLVSTSIVFEDSLFFPAWPYFGEEKHIKTHDCVFSLPHTWLGCSGWVGHTFSCERVWAFCVPTINK